MWFLKCEIFLDQDWCKSNQQWDSNRLVKKNDILIIIDQHFLFPSFDNNKQHAFHWLKGMCRQFRIGKKWIG
jgi:hypothetical protein